MIPRTSVVSCVTFESKNEPLSVLINVGRNLMISMKLFAVLTVVALDTG